MAARRRNADRRKWPANLYQNGAGSYWYKNTETGKTYGLGRDFTVAVGQARLANLTIEERKGNLSLVQRINGSGQTLAEWCKAYEDKFCKVGNKNTIKAKLSQLKAIVEAPCSAKSVALVTPKDMADLVNDAAATRGAAMAAKIRSRASDVFRDAIENGLIEPGKNPVDAILQPTVKVSRARLTVDDFKAIVTYARTDAVQRWAANAFLLALLCAQRREDVKAVQFSAAKDGFLWVEQVKTKIKVRIPLSVRLEAIGMSLDEVLRLCRDDVVSRYAIHFVRHMGGTKPGQSPGLDAFSAAFAACRDGAKIKVPEGKTPPTFHEIRSLAARLYTAEYGKDFAQAILGHKSSKTTDLYRDVRGQEWTEVPMLPAAAAK